MHRASFALSIVIALAACAKAETGPALTATPVPLSAADPALSGVGKLGYRSGLVLESADPAFGGWSDLQVAEQGRLLTAIGDQGAWMTVRLAWDERERFAGATLAAMGPLLDEGGAPLADKALSDAESLAPAEDGGWLVGFERAHRLWHYAPDFAAGAEPLVAPPALAGLPPERANSGLEALAHLPDGTLLAFLEGEPEDAATPVYRLLPGAAAWEILSYPLADGFQVTGAAPLANGALLVLERFYSPVTGPKARLRFLSPGDLAGPALGAGHLLGELALPLAVDNFEGVAAFEAPDGALTVLLLSDDNFNKPAQGTLLLAFELALD